MVLIIAGISFVGYLAIRILGSRNGVLVTGMAGGLISSTAVAISLSGISKHHPAQARTFAAGIIMACTLMFLRVLLEAFVIDVYLGWKLLPIFLFAALFGGAYGLYLYRGSEHFVIDTQNTDFMMHPLQISTSLKFGLLFGIIYGVIKLVANNYGDLGVYVVSALSGVTDVDAITLSLAAMAQDKTLIMLVSMWGITIASSINTMIKTGIVYWISGVKVGNLLLTYSLIVFVSMGMGAALMLSFNL